MTWRQATRDEVYTFYDEYFPEYVTEFPSYLTATGPKEFGVSFFQPHPVKKEDRPPRDFIRRDTWKTDNGSRYSPVFSGLTAGDASLSQFLLNPAGNDPLKQSEHGLADPALLDKSPPLPEGVYHSLAHWERSHLVVFDIDAKDIAYERASTSVDPDGKDRHEVLAQAGILTSDPPGCPYEFADIRRALEYGFKLQTILVEAFTASETMVVYSGQGCHVYLLDDDREHYYDTESRRVLATLMLEKYEIPIDKHVTIDSARLIRVPYSLHAGVCRVVQPISSPSFDFRSDAVPPHLSQEGAEL